MTTADQITPHLTLCWSWSPAGPIRQIERAFFLVRTGFIHHYRPIGNNLGTVAYSAYGRVIAVCIKAPPQWHELRDAIDDPIVLEYVRVYLYQTLVNRSWPGQERMN